MKHLLLITTMSIFLCACHTEASKTLANKQFEVQPILTGNYTNDTIFVINAQVENTVEAKNGSNLIIPANALVDADGNIITGDVEVNFKQYHSMVDILASGIPMTFDTLGTSFSFKSAGMFNLEATSNNESVFVKEGENIQVNLASDKDKSFNFYKLDEQTGEWQSAKNKHDLAENEVFDESIYPKMPEVISEEAFVMDINMDLSNYNELKMFDGIVWEYTGNTDELDPRKNKWINKTRWSDLSLEPTKDRAYEYFLTFKNKLKIFKTRVKAGLSDKDMEKAVGLMESKKLALAQQADDLAKPFVRSVNISGFGTYNYDYIHQIEEPAQMVADFDFGKYNGEKSKSMVAVIYEDEDAVVNFPHGQWASFNLDTKGNPKIIAVLPNNKVAIYTKDVSASFDKSKMLFKMDVLPGEVASKADLLAIIAEI